MHKKLEEIISKTKEDLISRIQSVRPFVRSIKNPKNGSVAIIAEIKLASPEEGLLGRPGDIISRARQYEKAGADAVSVVTEQHFFKGDPAFVGRIKKEISLPVLQKDFVINEYQIYESKIAGADAVLLIARLVNVDKLKIFSKLAQELGMEPVVEVNSKEDLIKVVKTSTKIIAVNARDLDTFEVNIDKACALLREIASSYIRLGFSGVSGRIDAKKYKNAGANGILIGTSLMKTRNISQFIERIGV